MNAQYWKGRVIWAALPVFAVTLILLKWRWTDTFSLLLQEILVVFGYIAAVGDIREHLVPNRLILAMVGVWWLAITPQLFMRTDETIPLVISGAVGALLAGILFVTVYIVSRHGLGGGDVKFMTVAGFYLGAQGVLPTMLMGSILAAVVGLFLIATKRIDRKGAIALIPFLYIGALMTMFFR